LDEKYGGEKCSAFFSDLERLKKGEPLAYVIGFVDFLNCKIDLEFKPLIPRVETEFWVKNFSEDMGAREARAPQKKLEILDIFSGSGCIGISLLKNLGNIHVDFSEINKDFTKQIKKNLELNNTEEKSYNIFNSDVFEKIPLVKNEDRKYDFIFANPPYVPKEKEIDKSVLDFEDHSSLFAKENGLFFVKKIILEGKEYLKKDGKIFIEFDETSKKEIEGFLKENKIKNFKFKKDQFQN
jgi:release factor glutamine methyltransferase